MPSLAPEIESNPITRAPTERRVGLAFPMAPNTIGGLGRASGADNDTKIIMLALMATDSENPFQQPTVNIDSLIFDLADGASFAVARRKLEETFAAFQKEHRYRLLPETITYSREEDGTVTIDFSYHNLESDQISNLSTNIGSR